MIDLHTFPTSNGQRVTIMLEECALPYRVRTVDLSKGEQLAPEFLKLNPVGAIPVIVDPDGPGSAPLTLAQSSAILLYLAEKTGRFLPPAVGAPLRGAAVADACSHGLRGGDGIDLPAVRACAGEIGGQHRVVRGTPAPAVSRGGRAACRP